MKYIGHIFTSEGIKIAEDKIETITKMPAPVDVSGVRRLLAMINYVGKYVPNLSAIIEPPRILLKKILHSNGSLNKRRL